jgi:heat shock protein HslJ
MIKRLTTLVFLLLGAALPLAAGAAPLADSLAGSSWVLTEYAVQRAAPLPAVGEQPPTLVFGTDGTVSGNTGCNGFGGEYSETGDHQLTFGPIISTLRACEDPDIHAQEQLILRVLDGEVVYTHDEDTLTISAPAGMLVYAAEPGSVGMPRTGEPTLGWLLLLLALAPLVVGLVIRLRHKEQPL